MSCCLCLSRDPRGQFSWSSPDLPGLHIIRIQNGNMNTLVWLLASQCGWCGVITWVIAAPTRGFATLHLRHCCLSLLLSLWDVPRNSSTALESHVQTAGVKTVTPADLSCAGPHITRFLHGQLCSHLLWMHKEWFADSWLFLNNFKLLLHSHHCISAPDWMQIRASCPGLGWVEIPAQPDPPVGVTHTNGFPL